MEAGAAALAGLDRLALARTDFEQDKGGEDEDAGRYAVVLRGRSHWPWLLHHSPALAQAPPGPAPHRNPNQVAAGELLIEPPTLQNLGFEWFIDGDANRNARVEVAYREQGSRDWKRAQPLLRLGGERIYSQSQVDVIVPPMFAGSILDLKPDTAYEARFTLRDPDGVSGAGRSNAGRAHATRTRAVCGRSRASTSIRTASRARRSSRRSKA